MEPAAHGSSFHDGPPVSGHSDCFVAGRRWARSTAPAALPVRGAQESPREQQMVQAGNRQASCSAGRWALAIIVAALTAVSGAQTAPSGSSNAIPTSNFSSLNASWTAVGPAQVASQRYGLVTGRVTAIAIDPADPSGNTVYLGTTGGGVWKSVNAAGPVASVTFTPLTDTLSIFSAGGAVLPSLSIGSISISGRVILAGTGDPNDALDSYYGEGILRSADSGLTWTLAQQSNDAANGHHGFTGLAVAGLAWSTSTPNLVVAALSQSAEGVLVNAVDTFSVMGLYYSKDAGLTWQMSAIQDGNQFVQQPVPGGAPGNAATAVVWNPLRARFYAAVRFHGFYESADGVTWTRLTVQPGTGLTSTACPANPNSVGSPACPVWRGALTVQPTTGDTFAFTVDANNQDQGIWQDVCALTSGNCAAPEIAFSKKLASAALEVGNGNATVLQGDYNLSLAAVANGADTLLFAGAEDLYRCSLNAGCLWRNTTNAVNGCAAPAKVSPAMHALATAAAVGTAGLPLIFVGNDGGIWRSTDGINQRQATCSSDDANHFDNLNAGLGSLAEVVSLAQHPTDPATLLVGLGGNGTAAGGSTGAWMQMAAGEGGFVAIDQVNPQNWFVTSGAGVNLHFCGKGTSCTAADFSGLPTIGAAQVARDSSLIDEPILLDPVLPTSVLVGTCRVWRGSAQSGGGWPGANEISPILGSRTSGVCGIVNGMIRSLAAGGPASGVTAVQDAGSTVLYAGMAGNLDGGGTYGGHVFVNYLGGTAGANSVWTDIAKSSVTNDTAGGGVFNPGSFDVSSVVTDAHDATGKTVYASIMGFAGNGKNSPHVYRSLDGGASWTNISANLPNVPANSLLNDPNDANTIYVATDAGIYATTQVSSCTTSNCWSFYGAGLPNSPVTTLAAAAAMSTGDGRLGELRAGTYGRGVWQIPLLTAASPAAPAMTLTPGTLTFSFQAVGTASSTQTISITNSGVAALTVSSIMTSADFAETDNCVGTVSVGGSCSVQVKFTPGLLGPRAGMITVYGNVAGGQATATLSGVGLAAAAIVLDPIALTFPAINLGSSSAVQNITISNTGGVTATLQIPATTGDFSVSANTCGSTLSPGVGCTVSLRFVPTASGARSGSFTVIDSVGTQTASLNGQGLLPPTDSMSPASLMFATQQLGTASATQQVTLTNAGDAALTGISAVITYGDFTAVNGCANSLAGHAKCAITVTYVPNNVGVQTGLLTITDTYRSQTVALGGSGVAPAGVSLSPTSGLSFAATGVGLSASGQTVTLTNNGGTTLTIQSMIATGDFNLVLGGGGCGSSLSPATACTLQIQFAPASAGTRSGSLVVTDSAPNSPQSLPLSGLGVDFALSANGSTTQTIVAGAQAVYPLLLTSVAGLPGMVVFTCAGAPANSTCVVTPSSESLGSTSVLTVTVATNVAVLHWPGERHSVWFAMLLPLGFAVRRRRRLVPAAVLCLTLSGCMVSRLIPETSASVGDSTAPTPGGTYNLVVSGASAGLTRTVPLTLIVH